MINNANERGSFFFQIRYRPDWVPDATHLIAVFSDTDKVRAARAARATIITKDWLIDSHKRKRMLPPADYAIDKKKSPTGAHSTKKQLADDDDEEEDNDDKEEEEEEDEDELDFGSDSDEQDAPKKKKKAKTTKQKTTPVKPKAATPSKQNTPAPALAPAHSFSAKPKPPLLNSFREDDDDELTPAHAPGARRKPPPTDENATEELPPIAPRAPTAGAAASARARDAKHDDNGDGDADSNHTEELPVADVSKRTNTFMTRQDTVVLDLLSGCKIFLHGYALLCAFLICCLLLTCLCAATSNPR